MKTAITKLKLTGFRGATKPVEIMFDTKKPVTLIFGENGTGKSTIADALDFICNGEYGSLQDRSMSEQPKKHIMSLGQKADKVHVELLCPQGTFGATLTKDGPLVLPATGCPRARILRRSNVVRLLEAQPKQRYENLKEFISVPGIQKSENSLRDAYKTTSQEFDEAVRSYLQVESSMQQLWNAEGSPNTNPLAWAAVEAGKDIAELERNVRAVNVVLQEVQATGIAVGALDKAIEEYEQAHATLLEAEAKCSNNDQIQQDSALLKVLQDAKNFIGLHDQISICPVCEQGVKKEELLSQLDLRIQQMMDLSKLTKAVDEARSNFTAKKTLVTKAKSDFHSHICKLFTLLQQSSLKEIVDLNITWESYITLQHAPELSDEIDALARQLYKTVLACQSILDSRMQNDQKSISQRNAIKGYYDLYNEKFAAAKNLESISQKLQLILTVIEQQRKAYVEKILETISGEVQRLYSKIHPGEPIGKVRFWLKANTIGSLEFDGQFQNKMDVPPQAYYSESHLDTLGICVFLALAKHFMTDDTIVVLDDVVTSVDGPHLDRFMNLLHEEAPNFNQVIVTTHYRVWRDRYRNARGPAAKTQVIELRLWNLDWGIQSDEACTAIKELRACLEATKMDRQAIASKGGIQLESILDFLIRLYGCKMSLQDDPNYTLGALGLGIDSKLGKVLKTIRPGKDGQNPIETFLKPTLDELMAMSWIRNKTGCHFSNLGSEITDSEVRDFGNKVLSLAEAIICKDCEELPTRKTSGSYWQCTCGKLNLHPLIQPGGMLPHPDA